MSGAGAEAAAGPLRMFVAIDLPAELQRRLLQLVPAAPGVRPVAAGQVHLTLHFLGDVAAAAVAPLIAALGGVPGRRFPLVIAGGGRFPPGCRPTVLWAGVLESGPLRDLHAAIAAALGNAGHAVEARPFVPHVTVARLQRHVGWAAIESFLRAADRSDPLEIAVDRFHLYRSYRGPDGQVHAIVRTFVATD